MLGLLRVGEWTVLRGLVRYPPVILMISAKRIRAKTTGARTMTTEKIWRTLQRFTRSSRSAVAQVRLIIPPRSTSGELTREGATEYLVRFHGGRRDEWLPEARLDRIAHGKLVAFNRGRAPAPASAHGETPATTNTEAVHFSLWPLFVFHARDHPIPDDRTRVA